MLFPSLAHQPLPPATFVTVMEMLEGRAKGPSLPYLLQTLLSYDFLVIFGAIEHTELPPIQWHHEVVHYLVWGPVRHFLYFACTVFVHVHCASKASGPESLRAGGFRGTVHMDDHHTCIRLPQHSTKETCLVLGWGTQMCMCDHHMCALVFPSLMPLVLSTRLGRPRGDAPERSNALGVFVTPSATSSGVDRTSCTPCPCSYMVISGSVS